MKNSRLNSFLMALFGMTIGFLIFIAIMWSSLHDPEFMYFVASMIVTLIILAFTWHIDKKSNKEINKKLDKIMDKMGIECEDESSQNNEDESASTEVPKRKCWFKAIGYQ